MQANQNVGKFQIKRTAFLLAFILSLLIPIASPQPAFAQDTVQADEFELGYLWALYFDFDNSFDGKLTIEVGPWVDGELVKVYETSTVSVRCVPVGPVVLAGGSAEFSGGHLTCDMDLGAIVLDNHGLNINAIDTYGSILLRTRLKSTSTTVAPIFTHADASYSIDFSQTSVLTQNQTLWNDTGMVQSNFNTVSYNRWQTHTIEYICIFGGGPCDGRFMVDAQYQAVPTAGKPARFSTGPASFQVGGAAFSGQIDALLVDPGNSAH